MAIFYLTLPPEWAEETTMEERTQFTADEIMDAIENDSAEIEINEEIYYSPCLEVGTDGILRMETDEDSESDYSCEVGFELYYKDELVLSGDEDPATGCNWYVGGDGEKGSEIIEGERFDRDDVKNKFREFWTTGCMYEFEVDDVRWLLKDTEFWYMNWRSDDEFYMELRAHERNDNEMKKISESEAIEMLLVFANFRINFPGRNNDRATIYFPELDTDEE